MEQREIPVEQECMSFEDFNKHAMLAVIYLFNPPGSYRLHANPPPSDYIPGDVRAKKTHQLI